MLRSQTVVFICLVIPAIAVLAVFALPLAGLVAMGAGASVFRRPTRRARSRTVAYFPATPARSDRDVATWGF